MTSCARCGKDVPDDALFCPACGAPLSAHSELFRPDPEPDQPRARRGIAPEGGGHEGPDPIDSPLEPVTPKHPDAAAGSSEEIDPGPETQPFSAFLTPGTPGDPPASQPWDVDYARPEIPEDLFRDSVPPEPAFDPDATAIRAPDGTTRMPYSQPVRPGQPRAVPYRSTPTSALPTPGTPEADLLPGERARQAAQPQGVPPAAPTSPEPSPSKSRRPALIVIGILAALLLVAIIGAIFWFSGAASPRPSAATPRANASTATPSRAVSSSVRPTTGASNPGYSTTPLPTGTPTFVTSFAFPPPGAKSCSDGVAAGDTTSCEFALNVAAAIPAGSTGTFTVRATSPVTNQEYEMTCTVTDFTTCTGGVNAHVYVK